MPDFRFPNSTQRTTIIGRTGSGKTQFAGWLLSEAGNYDKRPWIVLDFKGDRTIIEDIPGAQELSVTARLPRKSGIYVVRPLPTQGAEVEKLLWRIWEKQRTGVYVDESYMMPDKGAFSTLLVTGRSREIPMIMNTQRPSWVPRHMWSESDFFVVFQLNDRDDQRAVERFMPVDLRVPLPEHHSWFYDVGRNAMHRLSPVPDRDTILGRFAERRRDSRGTAWNGLTLPGPSKTGSQWF